MVECVCVCGVEWEWGAVQLQLGKWRFLKPSLQSPVRAWWGEFYGRQGAVLGRLNFTSFEKSSSLRTPSNPFLSVHVLYKCISDFGTLIGKMSVFMKMVVVAQCTAYK